MSMLGSRWRPSATDADLGFPGAHPFAVSSFPTTFSLASFPAEIGQWLISQHPEPPCSHNLMGLAPKTMAQSHPPFQF